MLTLVALNLLTTACYEAQQQKKFPVSPSTVPRFEPRVEAEKVGTGFAATQNLTINLGERRI